MATKRQDDPFPTTALVPAGRYTPTTLAPSQRTRSLDKAERGIVGEAHKQELVISEQARKTEMAQRAARSLYVSGAREYTAAADAIWEVTAPNGRDPQLQREVDQFGARMRQAAAGSIYAVTMDSVERIREEVNRTLYRETLERSGLLARLRGED